MDLDNYDNLFFDILNLIFIKVKYEKNRKIFLISNDSILIPLNLGMNLVYLSENLFTKKGVGLLPLSKANFSTKGLKWDVDNYISEFGSFNVSTSNEFKENEANIYVFSGYILLTLEINLDCIKNTKNI